MIITCALRITRDELLSIVLAMQKQKQTTYEQHPSFAGLGDASSALPISDLEIYDQLCAWQSSCDLSVARIREFQEAACHDRRRCRNDSGTVLPPDSTLKIDAQAVLNLASPSSPCGVEQK